MDDKLILLPAKDPQDIRLLRVPDDFEQHELYRYVTGVIAKAEEDNPDYDWTDIQEALEDKGFELVEFVLGPMLD